MSRPGRTLPPGKTRYPFYRRLGGPQGQSRQAENLVPTRIRSRTIQPVVSQSATRPTNQQMCINKIRNYHILFTDMFWLLLRPSSRGRTRIQTIYKQLHKMYNRNHSMLQLLSYALLVVINVKLCYRLKDR